MAKAKGKDGKAKRRTMRKPRASLRLLENNTHPFENLNENAEANLIELRELSAEQRAIRRGVDEYLATPPGTVYIRINKKTYEEPRKVLELINDFQLMRYKHMRPLEIAVMGLRSKYDYYITVDYVPLSEFTEEEELRANDYSNPGEIVGLWEVRRKDIKNFFVGFDAFGKDKETVEVFMDPIQEYVLQNEIVTLPHIIGKLRKYERAFYTAPAKLTNLRLRGLEGAIRRFETRRKKEIPREIQNILEEHIMGRPHPAAYIQGRDNLARINTNLFISNE